MKDFEMKLMNLNPNNPEDMKQIKDIMQKEINILNAELRSLEAYQISKIDTYECNIGTNIEEKNEVDFESMEIFGIDNLMLMKAIKKLIKANQIESEQKMLTKSSSSFNWLFYIFAFRYNHIKPVSKNNSINRTKCLRNINYVSNLEKMKSSILKAEPTKKLNNKSSENSTTDTENIMTKRGYKYLSLLRFYKNRLNSLSTTSNTPKNSITKKNKEVELEEPDCSDDWKYFAVVLDRLIFIIFSLVIPLCLLLMYANFMMREPVDFD